MINFIVLLLVCGLLVNQGAVATEKIVLPEEKCEKNLTGLAKTISGNLESYIYYGKSSAKSTSPKKDTANAESETSESKVKVTVGADTYEFTVKDMYECRVEKLSMTRSD